MGYNLRKFYNLVPIEGHLKDIEYSKTECLSALFLKDLSGPYF